VSPTTTEREIVYHSGKDQILENICAQKMSGSIEGRSIEGRRYGGGKRSNPQLTI
jgi:hypothetical protein